MIRTIEVHSSGIIQKVLKPNGELIGYQAGLAGNARTLTRCSTLAEARTILGIEIKPPTKVTKPKMTNPQNQKGYSPHRR